MMLINCSHCHTPLQLPPGASSVRCTICKSISYVSNSWGVPAPPGASHPLPPPGSLPHPSPSSGGGERKKAVICGVTDRNTRNELMGCINDAKRMKYLLINRYSFPEANVITLTGCLRKVFGSRDEDCSMEVPLLLWGEAVVQHSVFSFVSIQVNLLRLLVEDVFRSNKCPSLWSKKHCSTAR